MEKENYLLEGLNDTDIDWLISVGLKTPINADQTIIEEGIPSEALYIVLNGTFSIRLFILGNQSVAQVGPGEVLGEMSYVDGRPPSATVQATDNAEVLEVPSSDLTAKLETDREFSTRFFRALCVVMADRMRDTLNPDAETPQASNPERMEHILDRLRNA
ncbi:MAG: cyclic nucleotide-binding domain-containing protein [Candidatus Latescibacteria bacterium]|jgi:CRP-like cAMP-binding protein|nr:cyclic nucleotide-binding domain-containing protein [Candidatus Latescibacterota bacterium]